MPTNDLDLPECIHCLVARKDTDGALNRFLVTCIRNKDGKNFRQTEIECANVKLAALYQNRFLVTLERQHRGKFNLCCRPVDFGDPPRIGRNEVLEKNLSSDFSYKMVLAQTQEQNVVVLISRNGTTRSIQFNCP